MSWIGYDEQRLREIERADREQRNKERAEADAARQAQREALERPGSELEQLMLATPTQDEIGAVEVYRASVAAWATDTITADEKQNLADAMRLLKISGAAFNHDLAAMRRDKQFQKNLSNFDGKSKALTDQRIRAEKNRDAAKEAWERAVKEYNAAYQAETVFATDRWTSKLNRTQNLRLWGDPAMVTNQSEMRRHYGALSWPV